MTAYNEIHLPSDRLRPNYLRDVVSAGINCRRVSVHLSVTSRCSTEMAKRIGSHKQRHTIAQRF